VAVRKIVEQGQIEANLAGRAGARVGQSKCDAVLLGRLRRRELPRAGLPVALDNDALDQQAGEGVAPASDLLFGERFVVVAVELWDEPRNLPLGECELRRGRCAGHGIDAS
jgi:hypothetical protein